MVREHLEHHRAASPVTARDLLEHARGLLLDFDGPVTALMPPPYNAEAAARARAALADVPLPPNIATTTDHLAILTYAAESVADLLPAVEAACVAAEVASALRSEPSPELADWWALAERRQLSVAIVSNNAQPAVVAFLERHGWADKIDAYACREPLAPHLMKPDPHLVTTAVNRLGLDPRDCAFIGDSTTDVTAGHLAGVPVIGLATNPTRAQALEEAGADAILTRR